MTWIRPLRNVAQALVLAAPICALAFGAGSASVLDDAMRALEQGQPAVAEQLAKRELQSHPADPAALSVAAISLDQQRKYAEAEPFYRKAFVGGPVSAGLFNNYGNHLVAMNRPKEAVVQFERALKVAPDNTNAHAQLARLLLQSDQTSNVLTHIQALSASVQQRPDILLTRMQALYKLGRTVEADVVLHALERTASGDSAAVISIADALCSAGEKSKALELLDSVADDATQTASARANGSEMLYDLSVVYAKLGRLDRAVQFLGQAARSAPASPDIQKLLALCTARLGYFADSAQAWQAYMKLAPNDQNAVREYAFVQTASPQTSAAGLDALRRYLARNPTDASGHYELGTVLIDGDPDTAALEFKRAIMLDPGFVPAHVARGILLYEQGHPQNALPDLEFAAARASNDPLVLDRLGQTQLKLNRTAQAILTLERAAQLAPSDARILLHLGRALNQAGRSDEAKTAYARARELGPSRATQTVQAGLLDYVSLPPEQQLARYRAGVQRAAQSSPDNVEAQVRYMQILLDQGDLVPAIELSKKVAALSPTPAMIRETENTLLAAGQDDAAQQFKAGLLAKDNH